MAKITQTYYSVSYAGEDAGFGHQWPWMNLDDLRRWLIRRGASDNQKFDVYSMYDISFDKHGEVRSFKRRLIGTLSTGKKGNYEYKGTWKSKQTGKTYDVDPKNGAIRRKGA